MMTTSAVHMDLSASAMTRTVDAAVEACASVAEPSIQAFGTGSAVVLKRSKADRVERAGRPRLQRRPVHGVLLLDKPIGLTSNDALQIAKRLLRAEKAGHTGTLDPLATGLLPLCFGAATKFSQVSLDADKAYRATLRLGQTTASGDAEGEVLETRPVMCDEAAVRAACAGLLGEIDQIPPMHSALKHEGKALYEYARAGVTVDRPARRVTIHRIDIVEWQDERLVIDVVCSKGTYVRTLATDIGAALGCGAHLVGLRRTGSGPLDVSQAITLDALNALSEVEREGLLRGPDALLQHWPAVRLDAQEAEYFLRGMRRLVGDVDLADVDADHVRVYGPMPAAGALGTTVADSGPGAPVAAPSLFFDGLLLGSAHIAGGELIADRLLSPLEVAALMGSGLTNAQVQVQTQAPAAPPTITTI